VPFVVNNNGRLSETAAALLFENCLEPGPPDGRIAVLEPAAGTGLFARYFLGSGFESKDSPSIGKELGLPDRRRLPP
jgi:hypothetical protein